MSSRTRTGRARGASTVALIAVLAALVVVPSAWAHSVLIATEPAGDAVVEESPTRVLLRFNEPVETALGAIQVYDGSGNRVDAGEVSKPKPAEVVVAIEGELEPGTYTVAWRVISADSDPINGAFVFHNQERGANPAGIVDQVSNEPTRFVDTVFTTGRFFEFLFLILCAGGVAALVYPLRSADERVHRRLYGLLAAFAGGLAVVSLLGIPFQGAAAAGSSLAEAFSWDVFTSVLETRYGRVELLRFFLALGLAGLALWMRRTGGRSRETGNVAAAIIAAALVVTPPFAGHASTSGPLAVVADIAHVLAAAAWVGGLGFVVLALYFALDQRWPLATRCVPRFSTMAVGAVGLLLVAGTTNGYLQIETWRGLWETDYGLLLLAKVALVLPLLGLGAYNNRYAVPRLRAGVAQPQERRRFMQAASMELGVMVAIIGVTAVLVNTNPAKHALEAEAAAAPGHDGHGPAQPSSKEIVLGDFKATLVVEPGAAGPNTIELELDHTDPNFPDLAEVRFSASLADPPLGPLVFQAKSPEHGVWRAEGADLTVPGDWEIRVEAREGEFDLYTETVSIPIGEASR
jgi:copper transport protein